jgi:glycosyltransferase involved in cell wall biosynthesis
MIIGIDASRSVTTRRTGTEAYAYFLIRALIPQAVNRGHSLLLYYNQPPPPDHFSQAADGASLSVVPVVMPFPRLWSHLRLAFRLHRQPPDTFFTPAHVIPFSYRGPAVATVHDLGYRLFPEAHPVAQRHYLHWSTVHNSRRSRRIIADSQATRRDLVTHYGVDEAKVDVVYPGYDPALKRPSDAHITAALHKHQIIPPYLLYLGTLQPRKNLVRLVEAFAASRLATASPSYQLVLAGKVGWLAQPILEAVEQLDSATAQQVRLPGYIAEQDKAALLSGATALVFPSLYEGFGFPVLEAQVCETAVITANTSSLPEVVGDAGLLIDPLNTAAIGQAMVRLCQDEALRQRLVAAGLQNKNRFSWEQAAAAVLDSIQHSVTGKQ